MNWANRVYLIWIASLLAPGLPQATATSYRPFQDHEFIIESELVIEGTVESIIPPAKTEKDKLAISIAIVRVDEVFKGEAQKGAKIRLRFQSHGGERFDMLNDRYEVGEKLLFLLSRARPPEDNKKLKGLAEVEWGSFPPVYRKQIQSERLRKVAAIWKAPEKAVHDPDLSRDAVMFLAVQKRLHPMLLAQLLAADDMEMQLTGCLAASTAKSRAALAPLVVILEKNGREIESWDHDIFVGNHERKRRVKVRELFRKARDAIWELPIDGNKDGALLAQWALSGSMNEPDVCRSLLRAGKARWEVREALIKATAIKSQFGHLRALHVLDPRAAYEPLRKIELKNQKHQGEKQWLVARFCTAWAMRFVLEKARDAAYGPDRQFYYLSQPFGFTHGPVDPRERRKDLPKDKLDWDFLFTELQKAATEELAVFEKKGPNFASLAERLKNLDVWDLHGVGREKFGYLAKQQREDLTKLIVHHADPQAKGLDPNAEAAWLVDLSWSQNEGQGRPHGQLWVAADGTFGFGWLPDRAWGKCDRLPELLKQIR